VAFELCYTSVPKGLRPGTTGFCTVALTEGTPAPVAKRLEKLGGYRPMFPPDSPDADKNPIALSHWRINVDGQFYSVLSRICFAGEDHAGRSNKFAHHLALDPTEQVPAGPAWVMMQPGVMRTEWIGPPKVLRDARSIPDGSNPLRICQAWRQATGDAGWAGALANVETFHVPLSVLR